MAIGPKDRRSPGHVPSKLDVVAEEVEADVAALHESEFTDSLRRLEARLAALSIDPLTVTQVVNMNGGPRQSAPVNIAACGVLVVNDSTLAVTVSVPGDMIGVTVAAGARAWWVIPKSQEVICEGTGTGNVFLRLYNYTAAQLYR